MTSESIEKNTPGLTSEDIMKIINNIDDVKCIFLAYSELKQVKKTNSLSEILKAIEKIIIEEKQNKLKD